MVPWEFVAVGLGISLVSIALWWVGFALAGMAIVQSWWEERRKYDHLSRMDTRKEKDGF